jgi:hypothetical protein
MITRVSSVIRPKGSDLIFDHPYNAESVRLMIEGSRSMAVCRSSGLGLVSAAMRSGTRRSFWLGAGKSIRHKPVEAHMLFGGFVGKATVDLGRNAHYEAARIGPF